jgi:negative regulator of flagellin synthesis FlgM
MTNLTPIDAGAIGRIPAPDLKGEPVESRKPARARRGDDRVEVSDAARFLAKLNAMPEVRSELVERVRNEIASGTYDTPEKFDLALDAMIDEAL